jgi:hypothetical protein
MRRTKSAFQTCSPQRHYLESKAGGSHNQIGAKMTYQITDLTYIQKHIRDLSQDHARDTSGLAPGPI